VSEIDEGRQQFLDLVKSVDPSVHVVIPVASSNSLFLVALSKGQNKKFITVPEDDILDLPNEADIRTKIIQVVRDAVAAL
jgi:hypothetical protein